MRQCMETPARGRGTEKAVLGGSSTVEPTSRALAAGFLPITIYYLTLLRTVGHTPGPPFSMTMTGCEIVLLDYYAMQTGCSR